MMIEKSDEQILLKLKGITVVNTAGNPQEVKVVFSSPETWLSKIAEMEANQRGEDLVPSICVHRLPISFDSRRYTSRRKISKYTTVNKTEMGIKEYMHPFNIYYQVDFLADYQEHVIAIMEGILKKMPPMGFRSYISVVYVDSEDTILRMDFPFRLVDVMDLTSEFTSGYRRFRHALTYKVEAWLDLEEYTNIKTVVRTSIDWLQMGTDDMIYGRTNTDLTPVTEERFVCFMGGVPLITQTVTTMKTIHIWG
jgi:hypothetical protein